MGTGAIMGGYLRWLLFSVVIALLHLIVAMMVFPMYKQKIQITKILMQGSLLFFAMSLTSACFGDFLACEERVRRADPFAFFLAILIVIGCTVVYANLVKDKFIVQSGIKISPEFVSNFSLGASLGAVFYGSALFFLM